jgi:nucleotide-binding universal stress UspA family protein
MKTIIAPTDFSAMSYNACLYAAEMARDINAKLLLLHVIELPVSVAEFPVSEEVFEEISMEDELEKLKNKLSVETDSKVDIDTRNILGSVEFELKELCKAINPFLVIMSSHTTSALDRFFMGSTTVYSATHLRYPVLVVPANVKYKPVKKIALASDLKNIYAVPVREIETLIKTFNAVTFEIYYAGRNEENINKHSVDSLLLDHRLLNLNPEFYFVEDEDIMRGVTALAEKDEADILIIIPKKHGPFHKSKTKDFIFYSSVPVLAIHEDDVIT